MAICPYSRDTENSTEDYFRNLPVPKITHMPHSVKAIGLGHRVGHRVLIALALALFKTPAEGSAPESHRQTGARAGSTGEVT